MAAGLSLEPAGLDAFREDFEQAVRRVLGIEAMKPQIDICGEVSLAELDDVFFEELEQLEPFGHSNPEPVFLVRGVTPERIIPAGRFHCRGQVREASGARIQFIAFGKLPENMPPPPWDLVFTPQINRFAGLNSPQLRVIDVRTC